MGVARGHALADSENGQGRVGCGHALHATFTVTVTTVCAGMLPQTLRLWDGRVRRDALAESEFSRVKTTASVAVSERGIRFVRAVSF